MERETARLTLRHLTEQDVPAYRLYLDSNRSFAREWTPLRAEDYYSEGTIRSMVASQEKMAAARSAFFFALFRKDENRVLGSVSVTNIVYGPFQSCTIGYELGEAEVGKGYMTEALRSVVDFCFDHLLLHRVEANVMPRNERSKRVLKRLGFECEGLSRRYLKINGTWEDHEHHVLLNSRVE